MSKRALTPPPQTVAQCKCGQNSYPQSAHTNKSFSAVERSSFLKLSLSWPKKSDLETFTGNLAFSDAAQIEDAMVAIGKSGLGKSGGWYVAAVGHNRRTLHSRLSEGVAKKIEGDHPGTSHSDKISGDMKIMPISGDTGGHQPMAKIVIGLTLHC